MKLSLRLCFFNLITTRKARTGRGLKRVWKINSLHSQHTDTVHTCGCCCSVCHPRKLHCSGSQNVILSPGPNLTFAPTTKSPDLPRGAQYQGVISKQHTKQIKNQNPWKQNVITYFIENGKITVTVGFNGRITKVRRNYFHLFEVEQWLFFLSTVCSRPPTSHLPQEICEACLPTLSTSLGLSSSAVELCPSCPWPPSPKVKTSPFWKTTTL